MKDIPKGMYCYHGSRAPGDKNYKPCKYWEMKTDEDGEDYGYCHFLKMGDFDNGKELIPVIKKGSPIEYREEYTMLLWDQIKECGENNE